MLLAPLAPVTLNTVSWSASSIAFAANSCGPLTPRVRRCFTPNLRPLDFPRVSRLVHCDILSSSHRWKLP